MKIFLDKRCIINLCFLFLYLSSAFATSNHSRLNIRKITYYKLVTMKAHPGAKNL